MDGDDVLRQGDELGAMADRDDHPVLRKRGDEGVDPRDGVLVEVGGWFVEEEHRGGREERAGEGQPGALPRREAEAGVPELGVELVGECIDDRS